MQNGCVYWDKPWSKCTSGTSRGRFMTPAVRIREAKKNFWFAALQWAAMKNNRFRYSCLPNGFNWTIEGETRLIKWTRSEEGFRTQVTNQLRAALAVLVVETDSSLTDHFLGEQPHEDRDDERRAARCIIYMLRCAFAHHPLQPTWNVTNDKYKGKFFVVPPVDFKLDTMGLHGKPLDVEDLNWFKLLDLIDHCITYVE